MKNLKSTEQQTTCNDNPSPIPVEPYLDLDAAARDMGMRPVRAWIANEQAPEGPLRKAGALRTKRSRDRAEQNGVKQLSVSLPMEFHPLFKEFALRVRAGESPRAVLAELLGESKAAHVDLLTQLATGVRAMPRWRRWLLAKIFPASALGELLDWE